jgi:integrase/recombinase XerD
VTDELPEIIHRAGANAVFAAQEFFFGTIRNEHTRRAYLHAVKLFLGWIGKHGGGELTSIAPWHVGKYFEAMKETTGIATRNLHLSALRHFFDGMVTRHAIALNPALSVRGERYAAIEGKTPEISIEQARQLLASLDTTHVIGLRDRAILAILVYTSSRAGAVAKLKRGDFYSTGQQHMLHFTEKAASRGRFPSVTICRSWYRPISTWRDCAMRQRIRRCFRRHSGNSAGFLARKYTRTTSAA